MNKSELVDAIAERAGVTKTDADAVLKALEDVVTSEVAGKGDKITLTGFVSFERVRRNERTARNPQTGETIHVPAANAMKVSAGSKLKKAAKAS